MPKNIIFVHNGTNTFINADIAMLNTVAPVTEVVSLPQKKAGDFIKSQVKLLIKMLKLVPKAACVYVFFADYHAFWPVLIARLLGKPAFVVQAGYDTTCVPQLKYGSMCSRLRAYCAKTAMRLATLNLPVSKALGKEVATLVPKARQQYCYFGADPNQFTYIPQQKQDLVLTVGNVNSFKRFKIKGIDFFARVATLLPQVQFVVVGVHKHIEPHLGNVPLNLTVLGPVTQNQLHAWYAKAKVYGQFSMREGHPNAVCEAMLSGCIPVVTPGGGLPETVGPAGQVIQTPCQAANAIKKALNDTGALALNARQWVINTFPMEQRQTIIGSLIKKLCQL